MVEEKRKGAREAGEAFYVNRGGTIVSEGTLGVKEARGFRQARHDATQEGTSRHPAARDEYVHAIKN